MYHFNKELINFIFNEINFLKNIRIISRLNWEFKDKRYVDNEVMVSLWLYYTIDGFM